MRAGSRVLPMIPRVSNRRRTEAARTRISRRPGARSAGAGRCGDRRGYACVSRSRDHRRRSPGPAPGTDRCVLFTPARCDGGCQSSIDRGFGFENRELPPRVRGGGLKPVHLAAVSGATPADAGRTGTRYSGTVLVGSYPRGRGEDQFCSDLHWCGCEPPPRLRGESGNPGQGNRGPRSTPASAGRTRIIRSANYHHDELPPRVRGGLGHAQADDLAAGATPACAGRGGTFCDSRLPGLRQGGNGEQGAAEGLGGADSVQERGVERRSVSHCEYAFECRDGQRHLRSSAVSSFVEA